jgi:hypothetical protein
MEMPDSFLKQVHKNIYQTADIEVLTAVYMKMAVFWVIVPCILMEV